MDNKLTGYEIFVAYETKLKGLKQINLKTEEGQLFARIIKQLYSTSICATCSAGTYASLLRSWVQQNQVKNDWQLPVERNEEEIANQIETLAEIQPEAIQIKSKGKKKK